MSHLERRSDSVGKILISATDLFLGAVVFVAPLVMGGRHPAGRLVYSLLVCCAAAAWCLRQCFAGDSRWRFSGVEWLLLASITLIILQIMPLSPGIYAGLAPNMPELLPMWSSQQQSIGLGTWQQLSFSPQATRGALVMFLSHVILFVTIVQRVQSVEDIEKLIRWMAIAAVSMAVLGFAQFLFGNGKFLWIYEYPYKSADGCVRGTLSNQNHFAHIMALGTAPLIWWFRHVVSGRRKHSRRNNRGRSRLHHSFGSHRLSTDQDTLTKIAVALSMGTVILASLLTYSRGGVIVVLLAALVCVGLFVRRSMLPREILLGLSLIAVMTFAGILVYGYTELSNELSSITAGSLDDLDSHGVRRKLWAADIEATGRFPLFGYGGRTHAVVYPIHFELEKVADLEFVYGENGYIQILLEYGLTGLVLLFFGIGVVLRWIVKALRASSSERLDACTIVFATGFVVSLLHSIVDFVWFIPACMSLTVILMACLCRLHQLSDAQIHRPNETKTISAVWVAATVAIGAIAIFVTQHQLPAALASPHWERYAIKASKLRSDASRETVANVVPQIAPALQEAVRLDPNDARANLKLAAIYLRHFELQQMNSENPMPLSQIRAAATSSGFPSRKARDQWLAAVVGENRQFLDRALLHVQRGLRLSPLQGEGYLMLADLVFLEHGSERARSALMDQAVRLRPHNGFVLLAAGTDAWEAGNTEKAMKYWKQAFQNHSVQRNQIIKQLVSLAEAELFFEFQPDHHALRVLYSNYRDIGRDDQARVVALRYAACLDRLAKSKPNTEGVQHWIDATWVHDFLGNHHESVRCARAAAMASQSDFQARRNLTKVLAKYERYEEAIPHLQWCARHAPSDPALKRDLLTALKRKNRVKL